ncbi:MAG: glycerophosphodiester phosphodiesterase [bacterium]|nr:glycerophosphodiester phosphodiesterase [bacterium]
MHPYFDSSRPHLFGHRGASGEAPENTLPAFERAWSEGVPYLEMDCHASSDGEILIFHDADLARTSDGEGPLKEHSFAELQRLDAGYHFSPDAGRTHPFRAAGVRIPKLSQVLDAFPEARINLEIKQEEPEIAEEVVRLLVRAGALDRTLLAAEEESIMERLRKLDPGTALGSSLADCIAFVQAAAEDRMDSFQPRGDALQIPATALGKPLVTKELVAAAHHHGLLVHVWTINDPAEMKKLLALGVDGLMSDFPGRLIETVG